MRKITREEVIFTVVAEDEHLPVRGNYIVSGDEVADRAEEDEVLDRLDRGDVWAWCSVKVEGNYKGLFATQYLGGCSYQDEAEFRKDGYFDDMCDAVVEELNATVRNMFEELSEDSIPE